jgi:hypothetical protein
MDKFVTKLKRQRTDDDEPIAGSKAVALVSYELVWRLLLVVAGYIQATV